MSDRPCAVQKPASFSRGDEIEDLDAEFIDDASHHDVPVVADKGHPGNDRLAEG